MTPDQNGPIIQAASHILLTREEKGVLRAMFDSFSRLAIEAEFGSGYSGSRVFRVHPVDDRRKAQRPAVVKIAPIDLIVKERHAYEAWVETTLPRAARLVPSPMSSPGSELGGLRYDLVGGEIFELQSLYDYYGRASIEDLLWVLEERLFPIMSQSWWLDNRLERAYHMQVDYGRLLPVNLLITASGPLVADSAQRFEPGRQPATIAAGDRVLLQGFVVAEKDLKQRQLTLMLPSMQEDPPAASCRLRLTDVPDLDRYQVGSVVETIPGVVKATRHDLLVTQVTEALGGAIDLSAEQLDLSDDVHLPNPLTVYQDILDKFSTVRISIIHGDLNLENILVDPDTREVRLIDFATVREGHVLHDLLRLETQVVTQLIPEALTGTNLPVGTTIHHLYRRLHEAMVYSGRDIIPDLPHPELKKSFAMLAAIRQEARNYMFLRDNWTEYYQGLVLYLLGTLKFKNLDATAKQVAFWGAATLVDLLDKPPETGQARDLKGWGEWLLGHRRIVGLGIAGGLTLLLIVFMALELPPFQPRLVWAAGPLNVPNATVLHNTGTTLVVGGANIEEGCNHLRKGLWFRSLTSDGTWQDSEVGDLLCIEDRDPPALSDVVALASLPDEPNTVYALTSHSGLLVSTDAGTHFSHTIDLPTKEADNTPFLLIVSREGNTPIFWVAGEKNGLLVYRNDQWSRLDGQGEGGCAGLPILTVTSLLVTDETVLIGSDRRGIWVSDDGGYRCRQVFDPSGRYTSFGLWDVSPDTHSRYLVLVRDWTVEPGDNPGTWQLLDLCVRSTSCESDTWQAEPNPVWHESTVVWDVLVQPNNTVDYDWYLVTEFGQVWRGNMQGGGPERLPGINRCYIFLCDAKFAPTGLGKEPYLLAGERVYQYTLGVWWRYFWT